MAKVKSLAELKKLRDEMQNATDLREKGLNIDEMVQVKVSMATCGIASGARETLTAFMDEVKKHDLTHVVFTQTGCMGYCHSEPTVEVTRPGEEPVVYGNVKGDRILEIVEKHIIDGVLVDGVIPVAYKTIHE